MKRIVTAVPFFVKASVLPIFAACPLVFAEPLMKLTLVDLAGTRLPNALVEFDAEPIGVDLAVTDEYIMDQKDFQFLPRALVIPVGASVVFPNSDKSRHHVYSFSKAKSFELKLYAGNQAPPVLFDSVGSVALGCNIHDDMSAYIYVTESDIAKISDAQGQVTFPEYRPDTGDKITITHNLMNVPLVFSVLDLSISETGSATLSLPIALPVKSPADEASSLRDRLKSYKSYAN